MSKKKPNKKKYDETFSEYRSLLKILKKRKITVKDFYKNNQGDVINTANIMAEKINSVTKLKKIKNNYKFLDVGCGLGQITNEVAKIKGYKNTFACEPSIYATKFVEKFYPKLNFFRGGIEEIKKKYYNFFDVLYLKEVSPFRSSDIHLQKKLIKKLKKILTKDGIIIFEQIRNKGKQDIYSNLKKLKFKYELLPTIPNSILKTKLLRKYLLKNFKIIYFTLNIIDKIYFRYLLKKTYYIIIKKI